jgi:hypothetical protein
MDNSISVSKFDWGLNQEDLQYFLNLCEKERVRTMGDVMDVFGDSDFRSKATLGIYAKLKKKLNIKGFGFDLMADDPWTWGPNNVAKWLEQILVSDYSSFLDGVKEKLKTLSGIGLKFVINDELKKDFTIDNPGIRFHIIGNRNALFEKGFSFDFDLIEYSSIDLN